MHTWGYQRFLRLFMGLALLIMILAYALTYYWHYQRTIHAMAEKNRLIMQVARQDIDNQIQSVNHITQSLWRDYDVLAAIHEQSPYSAYKLSQRLSSFTGVNSGLLDIALFDNFCDYAYTSAGAIRREDYFRSYTRTGTDPGDLLETVWNTKTPTFYGFSSARLIREQSEMDIALYVEPISKTRKIVYVLNQSTFSTPIQNVVQNQSGSFVVLDAQGNAMLSMDINSEDEHGGIPPGSLRIPDFSSLQDEEFFVRDQSMYLSARSNTSAFYYVIITHPGVLTAELKSFQLNFFLSMGLVLSLGILLSLVFGRISYRPIQRLRDSLAENDADHRATGWKDLDGIHSQFRTIRENLEQTERRLQTDQDFLYNSLICGLVSSTSAYYYLSQSAYRQAGIELNARWTQVAVLRSGTTDLRVIRDLVDGVAKELGCTVFQSDRNEYERLVMVLHGDDKPSPVKLIHTAGRRLEEEGVDFQMGVGQAVEEVHFIRLSFSQAVTVLQEPTGERVRFYRSKTADAPPKGLPQDHRNELNSAIKSGDIKAAEGIIQDLFDQNRDHTADTFLYADIIYFLLVLARSEDAPDVIINNALYAVHRDQQEMVDALLYVVRSLSTQMAGTTKEPDDPLLRDILSYVEEHFTEQTLSVQHIADHFSISVSHLNRYAKNGCGKTVFSILDGMRMEYAMHMLADTQLPVREIVEQSGYGDVTYFTKKFKRTTGLTPGQYRGGHQRG